MVRSLGRRSITRFRGVDARNPSSMATASSLRIGSVFGRSARTPEGRRHSAGQRWEPFDSLETLSPQHSPLRYAEPNCTTWSEKRPVGVTNDDPSQILTSVGDQPHPYSHRIRVHLYLASAPTTGEYRPLVPLRVKAARACAAKHCAVSPIASKRVTTAIDRPTLTVKGMCASIACTGRWLFADRARDTKTASEQANDGLVTRGRIRVLITDRHELHAGATIPRAVRSRRGLNAVADDEDR